MVEGRGEGESEEVREEEEGRQGGGVVTFRAIHCKGTQCTV